MALFDSAIFDSAIFDTGEEATKRDRIAKGPMRPNNLRKSRR
jgi:hypothetical protein